MKKRHKANCDCAQCRNDKSFVPPDHLVEKIRNHEVVLFAGSGISTENPDHCRSTFYDEVRYELRIKDYPPFPELMTKYCAAPDGRIKLLDKIKKRLAYFASFDDFYRPMTRFHRAIAPLYMIEDIVTTNWDDFFERECMLDAFVHDSDLAFWDAAPRRVMKIHGSISNFGSIVATTQDYRRSFKRLNNGPLGAHLKSLIARKTVIYTGYSLSDTNYLRLLRNISKMMGSAVRQSYFIAPVIDSKKLANAPVPLVPIETDGAYFFEQIRSDLSPNGEIIKDDVFHFCDGFLDKVTHCHIRTAAAYLKTHHPLLIFALGYQDGLIHALQRIARQRKTGEYHSHARVHGLVHGYEHKLEHFLRHKDFWNAAYAQGYQNGMLLLLVTNESGSTATPPLFEYPFPVKDAGSLAAILRYPARKIPQDVASQVKTLFRNFPGVTRDLIPDHTPYL
jgi:NAD-dependent SIR2 family protein deacetylase